jgi:peptidoglycan/LPS O-acetylase OafA/YrhL
LILAVTVMAAAVLLSHLLYGDTKYMFGEGLTLLRVTYEFVIGCLLFNIFTGRQTKRGFDALAMAATAVIVGCSLAGTPNRLDWIFVVAFAALVLGLAGARGALGTFCSSRAMVWLGEISYSLYLIHSLVLSVVLQVAHRLVTAVTFTSAAATAATCVTLSILGGALLYNVVERPMRRRLRDLVT